MHKIVRKAAAPAALVLGLGVGLTALDASHHPVPQLGAQAPVTAPRAPGGLSTAFRDASHAALPAVVRVDVATQARPVNQQIPDALRDSPFGQFFGGAPDGAPRTQLGSGSGFIISPDGYVLTNNHVVENATRVTVTLTDKREFDAKVVGRDPNTDVAVIKIDARNLPTVRLGDSDALEVGDWVLALGYPMQLGETVTAGIVSAKGKNIGILRSNEEAQAPLEHFIQTDAAINPGNSGGPLIDLNGRVVGINAAIASETGSYSGYGFSVPIRLAKRVADDLIRYGSVHRPKLGVQIKDVSPADAEVFGLKSATGAVVASLPQGPAKDAGMELGDVIVGVQGEPVGDTGELMERIALLRPGQHVQLDVVRYGKHRTVEVELGQVTSETPASSAAGGDAPDAMGRLGFQAQPLTPELAQRLHIDQGGGVVVTGVDPMGPAAGEIGPGVRVDRLNGREIHSMDDLRAAASSLKPGSTVSIVGRLPNGTETILNYRLHG
jgi:serine protease Do